MKTLRKRLLVALVSGMGLAAFAPVASASWVFAACTQVDNAKKDDYGNSYSCPGNSGDPTATITAVSTTGKNDAYAAANLTYWSGYGFGIDNKDETLDAASPNHSMDNASTGGIDALLINFNSEVILNQLKLGWAAYDSDVSVLAYTGSGTPTVKGQTSAGLLGSGWELIGQYGNTNGASNAPHDGQTYSAKTDVNDAKESASWWLISAYNAAFGGNTLDNKPDYVKLSGLSASVEDPVNHVPEPGSLPLLALAAGVACIAHRRARRER